MTITPTPKPDFWNRWQVIFSLLAVVLSVTLVAIPRQDTQAKFFDAKSISGFPQMRNFTETITAQDSTSVTPLVADVSPNVHVLINPVPITITHQFAPSQSDVMIRPVRIRYVPGGPLTTAADLDAFANKLRLRFGVSASNTACSNSQINATVNTPTYFNDTIPRWNVSDNITPGFSAARDQRLVVPSTVALYFCSVLFTQFESFESVLKFNGGVSMRFNITMDAVLQAPYTATSNETTVSAAYNVPVWPPSNPAAGPRCVPALLGTGVTFNWAYNTYGVYPNPTSFILTAPDGVSKDVISGAARTFTKSGLATRPGVWTLETKLRDGTSSKMNFTVTTDILGLTVTSCS